MEVGAPAARPGLPGPRESPTTGVLVRVSGEAQVLATHTPALFQAAIRRAADLLRAGELVAVPTETVYGLAANALDARAVARLFEVKGRPGCNPVIVHVASVAMARRSTAAWPDSARKLAAAFWPGPLTLVLPKAGMIPDIVTAGGPTVGVRWPSHPFIRGLIRECGFPLAAPSANLSSRISPTTAEHVRRSLGRKIPCIVDGGPSAVGIESTVVDLSGARARVLRPGMIHGESLLAVLGQARKGTKPDRSPGVEFGPLRSPGQLPKHYAPRARLLVWSWRDAADLRRKMAAARIPLRACHVIAHRRVPAGPGFCRLSVLPHDAAAFARALYAELHRCDEQGAQVVIVEALPKATDWQAVADRLNRAAA